MKKEREGIIQIATAVNAGHVSITHIYGLSNFGKLYEFNNSIGEWILKGTELEQ